MYDLIYDRLGRLDSIYTTTTDDLIKIPLPFNSVNKTLDEDDRLTIALRTWEKENGALDLSDRKPELVPEIIGYRINNLLPSDRNIQSDRFPEDINFNTELTIGLTTKTIDYFGLRVAQVFYQSVDFETKASIPSIPVVFERYKYTWDAKTKLPLGRVKEIYFYLDNGNLSEQFKLLPKEFYNVSDRADITTRRRQTILAWLIARATELGLGAKVKNYFAQYKDQTDKYVLYGDCEILKTVQTSTQTWLDLDTTTSLGTIRNAITACFTKALESTSNTEVDKFLAGQV
jgi:hypothetical protein